MASPSSDSIESSHSEKDDLMKKIAEGEWDDSIESELGDAIADAIDDFGPDLDEEGNPLEESESDRVKSEEEREKEGRTSGDGDSGDGGDSGDDSGDDEDKEEEEDKEGAAA